MFRSPQNTLGTRLPSGATIGPGGIRSIKSAYSSKRPLTGKANTPTETSGGMSRDNKVTTQTPVQNQSIDQAATNPDYQINPVRTIPETNMTTGTYPLPLAYANLPGNLKRNNSSMVQPELVATPSPPMPQTQKPLGGPVTLSDAFSILGESYPNIARMLL